MNAYDNFDCQLGLIKGFYGISAQYVWKCLGGNLQSIKTSGREYLLRMSDQQSHPWPAFRDLNKTRE